MSRCHLLYQQAVFKSRENAQLGEEIKNLREQVEMRECTFRPKLSSARRPPSPRPASQPRNYESAVDVNVGHGRTGRIGVHEGDDLTVLSRNFGRAFQLDADLEHKLEELLRRACEERNLQRRFEE